MHTQKSYSLIEKFKNCFQLNDFYIHIIHEPFYKSFLFIFLVSLLVSIPLFFTSTKGTLTTTNEIINVLESSDFPDYTIKDGKLSTSPETIYHFKIQDLSVVIDTTGTYELNELYKKGAGMLFNEDSAILIVSHLTPTVFEYQRFMFLFTPLSNKQAAISYFQLTKVFAPFVMAFTVYINTLFIFLMTLFAAYIFIHTRKTMYQINLKRVQVIKLAIYSSTMPLVIYHILTALPIPASILSENGIALFALIILFASISLNAQRIIKLMISSKTDHLI